MIRKILAALALAFASPALAVPQGMTPLPLPPLGLLNGAVAQVLADSKGNASSAYVPIVGAPGAGGVKSLSNPLTWAEAALRGLRFDMTIAPPAGPLGAGQVIGLKQLRDYAGSGCTYATATVSGATGFSATATIANGAISAWTVTTPQTAGTAGGGYTNVAITSDCTGTVLATPVLGGYGSFSVGGQNLLEIRERGVDICAATYGAKPNIVVIIGGDNDLALSGALANWTGNVANISGKMLAQRTMNIVNDLAACGILPVVIAHPVRTTFGLIGVGYNSTQAQVVKETLAEMNYALRLAANGDATLNPSRTFFVFVDGYMPYYVDNSNASGDPINYLTMDGTHWNQWGAAVAGYWLAKSLFPLVQYTSYSSAIPALDFYDPVFNPSGNMSGTLWNGSTGSGTGLMSGTLPSASYNANTGGTAPSAGCITTSATVPTSAARDSEGLVTPSFSMNFACGGVAGTGSTNVVTSSLRWGEILPAGVAVGDYLEAACDFEYSNLNNIISISIGLLDSNTLLTFFMGGSNSNYMPRSSDPLVGSAGQFGWFGWPLRFHSAPLKVLPGFTSVRHQIDIYMDASQTPGSIAVGGVAGVSGTIKARNCTLQQLHPVLN